jgi:hypothetical protein
MQAPFEMMNEVGVNRPFPGGDLRLNTLLVIPDCLRRQAQSGQPSEIARFGGTADAAALPSGDPALNA